MTINEASKRHKIPIKILQEYESWGLCGEVKKVMGSWHYDGRDIERLSTIMTLHDIGFINTEVERDMKLLLQGIFGEAKRLKMLETKRKGEFQNEKLVSIFMVLTLLLSFTACGSNGANKESSLSAQQSSNQSPTPDEELNNQNDSSVPTETGAKSLVVYFPWSGNTENVAKSIQTQTDADIFEIVPATPYSDDYDTVVDLAQEEQRNNARPAIPGSVENIGQYDVIYVGFPKMQYSI